MKYCPNVFVAQCEEKHEKGDTINTHKHYDKTRNGTNDRGDALLIHQYVSKLSQPRLFSGV